MLPFCWANYLCWGHASTPQAPPVTSTLMNFTSQWLLLAITHKVNKSWNKNLSANIYFSRVRTGDGWYFLLVLEGKGPLHFGHCSTWLNTIKEGDMVPCFIQRYIQITFFNPSSEIILEKGKFIYFSNQNTLLFQQLQIRWIPSPVWHQCSLYPCGCWERHCPLQKFLATTVPWHEKNRFSI